MCVAQQCLVPGAVSGTVPPAWVCPQAPRVLAAFVHGGGGWTQLSWLSDPREGGWSGGSQGSPPQSVGGCLVEESSGGESPGLVKGLSLICKSLLGRTSLMKMPFPHSPSPSHYPASDKSNLVSLQ